MFWFMLHGIAKHFFATNSSLVTRCYVPKYPLYEGSIRAVVWVRARARV